MGIRRLGCVRFSAIFSTLSRKPCNKPYHRNNSSFDIFSRLKDSPGSSQESSSGISKKRKPSDRVIKLANEILNLTLIEAADLCEFCQEQLSPGTADMLARSPFPYPGNMFASPGWGQMTVPGNCQVNPDLSVNTTTSTNQTTIASPEEVLVSSQGEDRDSAEKEKEKKTVFTFKLLSFDDPRKVLTVKEVRAFTGLGLREAKEAVESAPKILKKGVPAEEADKWKSKFEAVGAVVELS